MEIAGSLIRLKLIASTSRVYHEQVTFLFRVILADFRISMSTGAYNVKEMITLIRTSLFPIRLQLATT